MKIKTTIEPYFLLLGDILVLFVSLYLALFLRRLGLPLWDEFLDHLSAFIFIFGIWVVIYFIYDLYSNQTAILQQKLTGLLFNSYIINSIIALAFFYFIPFFSITPKTNLFIFLGVSLGVMLLWRKYIVFWFGNKEVESILFTCSGGEVDELIREFKGNHFYNINILNPDTVSEEDIKILKPLVVINTHDQNTKEVIVNFYQMLFLGIRFITVENLYEATFGRIPTSLISERWFLESISLTEKPIYDFLKRAMDFIIALILGILSLIIYPLVFLAIKLDDGGDVFIAPSRVGKNNKSIVLYKFRTMSIGNDEGRWGGVQNRVTRVGSFLRRSRIDELPQLWNVVRGDLSLIGPRPEFAPAVEQYNNEIKYYNIRHLIKPGLSGWAQISQKGEPHHGINIDETKVKLSYDLFYIKHRSFLLDIKIALKTLRILLSRSGI
ncbi:MAG TPA: sugar transferase [Candidatus Paceibacterota bacterium]